MFWKKKDDTQQMQHAVRLLPAGDRPASVLTASLEFLRKVVEARLDHHFGNTDEFQQPPFTIFDDGSPFSRFVTARNMSMEEFLCVLLALSPHTHPDLFSDLIRVHLPKGGEFPEFGGVKGTNYRGIIPTGETALFVLAGMDIDRRLLCGNLLKGVGNDSPNSNGTPHRATVFQESIVTLEPVRDSEPEMSGRLMMAPERIPELLTGSPWRPQFGLNFPAARLESKMEWTDIVLPASD